MAISVLTLQNKLIDNYENISKVLIKLGFDESKFNYIENQHLIKSPRPEEGADNPSGCLFYTNSLNYIYTTRSKQGNIFTLTMDIKKISFSRALKFIGNCIGYKENNVRIKYPFGGFYKKIIREDEDFLNNLREYDEDLLPSDDSLSLNFVKDGISLLTQEDYQVRYDHDSNSILIPIYDSENRLIGCKARNNDPDCDFDKRWYAYLPYPKTRVIYGWNHNYKNIIDKQMAIITESEKGVMQLSSMGCDLGLSVAGHSISKIQSKYIKSLMVKRVIVAFDQDLPKDEIAFETKKLVSESKFFKNKIGYIYDEGGEVLPIGSKQSPTDRGKQAFIKLMKNNIVWIN